MKRRSWLLIAAASLIVLSIWGWRALYPSAEKAVRQRLQDLARTASAPVSDAVFAESLVEFVAEDAVIQVEVDGGAKAAFNNRKDFIQAAQDLRSRVGSFRMEFPDLNIAIGPDQKSADVDLTARVRVPFARDLVVQEMRFTLQKKGRVWLIRRIQPVKTLGQTDKPGVGQDTLNQIGDRLKAGLS